MPLIRKTPDKATGQAPEPAAAAGSFDEKWASVRDMAARNDAAGLAAALSSEKNPRIQAAIFTGLARMATKESVAAVLPYLRGDDATLRTGALDALRAMPEAVQPQLEKLLSDPDADVRLLACEIVRHLSGREASRLLCRLLQREKDSNVCASAVEVLAEIGDAEALPYLAECAERFRSDPFLGFALEVATTRLRTRLTP